MPKPQPAKTSAPPNTVTGLKGWVEVFKAGTHVDSKGKQITFSQADLDQVIENHKLGAAPAVLGHPKAADPAYAWADGYKRDGDSLFAKFKDINPAFEAGVKTGAYRNRSVSIFKDDKAGWRIRHIGWLGAQAPAIDGLQPVEFACAEDQCIEFAAPGYSLVWGLESIAKLLRGLREQMIAKDGIEAADTVLPQWQIDSAIESAAQARREFQEERGDNPLFTQHNPGDSMFTQADIDAAAEKARKDAQDAATATFAAKEAELLTLKAANRKDRITALVEGWKAAGLVTPAEEIGLAEFMATLDVEGVSEFSFSAHDKSEVKKTPLAFFADFMAARKPVLRLSGNKDDKDPADVTVDVTDATALGKAASEFMASEAKEGRVISSAAAVEHVVKQNKKAA
jgi:hypothetical protein